GRGGGGGGAGRTPVRPAEGGSDRFARQCSGHPRRACGGARSGNCRRQAAARFPSRRQDRALWRVDEPHERIARGRLSSCSACRPRSGEDVAMIAERHTFRCWPDAARWGGCFMLALASHAAGAPAILPRWSDQTQLVSNAPVCMVELAPAPVSPNITPNESPPGPEQNEGEPQLVPQKPIEKVELQPDPQAEPVTVMPPPKPVEKPKENKPKQKHASLASAPRAAEQQTHPAPAPMPGATSRKPNTAPNWKSQLVSRPDRYNPYPSQTQPLG